MGFLDNFKRRQPNYDSASQEYMQNISLLNPDAQLAIMGKISPNDLNTQTDYVKQGYSKESVKKEIEENQVSNINQMNEFRQAIDNYKNRYNQMNYDESMKDSIGQYTNVAYPYGEDDDIIKNNIKNTINDYIGVYGENNNLVTGEGQASGFRENYEEAQQQKIDYQIHQIIDNSDVVESSPTNEVETAQESPETKSIKNVEFQPNPFFKSELQKEKIDSDRKIIDSDKEYYTSDYYKTGKINYAKKVSLNVASVTKLNVANGMSETEWDQRLGYVLGDSSGLLYKIFHNDGGIVFPYTPKVDFEHTINYERTEIMHSNLAVSHYKNTPPPTIDIQADFTADGKDNAIYMFGVIHFLRSISKCEFGEIMLSDKREKAAGVPPPILYLNGYGNYMNNIPVVVESFGINFDKNKHYVHLEDNSYNLDVWLPTGITINIKLKIQFNLDKYKLQFDLNEYKKNTLGYNDNTLAVVKYQSFEKIYGQEVTTYSDNSTSNKISKGWTSFDREKTVRLNGSGWTW